MYLLRSVTKDIQNILSKNNIIEEIDLRISNLKKFDYQINNLVKYQNIDDIDTIKKDISNCLNNTNIVNNFEFADNLFINLKINESKFLDEMEDIKKIVLLKSKEEIIIDYGGQISENPFM